MIKYVKNLVHSTPGSRRPDVSSVPDHSCPDMSGCEPVWVRVTSSAAFIMCGRGPVFPLASGEGFNLLSQNKTQVPCQWHLAF